MMTTMGVTVLRCYVRKYSTTDAQTEEGMNERRRYTTCRAVFRCFLRIFAPLRKLRETLRCLKAAAAAVAVASGRCATQPRKNP